MAKQKLDNIMILCSLCNSFDTFKRDYYIQQMKKYRGATWCMDCEKEEEIVIRCKNCAEQFKIRPNVYNKLGFPQPNKCNPCRTDKKIAKCTQPQCLKSEELSTRLFLKKTKNQLLPFKCNECVNQKQIVFCAYGKHAAEVPVQIYQKYRDKEKFICKDCRNSCRQFPCIICHSMISQLTRFYDGGNIHSKVCDSCEEDAKYLWRLNEILKTQLYLANDGKNLYREEEEFYTQVKDLEPQLQFYNSFEELHNWYNDMNNLFVEHLIPCITCGFINSQTSFKMKILNKKFFFDECFSCSRKRKNGIQGGAGRRGASRGRTPQRGNYI
ncbi:hypothetical protein FGO68_gene9921 [Halteria grandinella]|uniref:Uncharacterized protein n=1 Tax=Halteria grandinella TaxID=5974 RepID=A0A8J8T718_HALGN|nr:hypothetical protein FGO68_gene9921 [Halteria grandinella]